MAVRIQLRKANAAEWALVNPVLADGEPGVERDTRRMKIGDGVTTWNALEYQSVGNIGPQGPRGDFTYAIDLIGTSATSLTIAANTTLSIQASTEKAWVPGMWLMVSYTDDATNSMVCRCLDYNPQSGSLSVEVGATVEGSGTYNAWTITYTVGVAVPHKLTHLTGEDALPLADSGTNGLMPATTAQKISRFEIEGAYYGPSLPDPAGIPSGSVFFCSEEIISTPPVISAIYPQSALLNEAFTINVFLADEYDVDQVVLTVTASSNTSIVPISATTIRGSGPTRFVDISARDTAGQSTLTLTATNAAGLASMSTFSVDIVAHAHTIATSTGTNGTHGTVTPLGAVLVPQTGNLTVTAVPNSGYAVSSLTVDGSTIADADYHIFNDVDADHTFIANFDVGYTIVATAIGNGTVSPSGNVGAVANSQKTFNFAGTAGFEPYQMFVDGGAAQSAAAGSYTFTGITTNHTISVNFQAIMYDLSWSGLTNGTIAGQAAGSASVAYNGSYGIVVVPNADYETYAVTVAGSTVDSAVHTGSFTYTIPAVTEDTAIGASFRIQKPAAVTPSVAVGASGELTVTWASSSRAASYDIYYKAGGTGTPDGTWTGLTGETSGHTITGLTNGTAYGVVVAAINSTGNIYSSVVNGVPSDNVAPTSTITATLPMVTSATAVKLVTDGSATGQVNWSLNLPSITAPSASNTIEYDFYDSGEVDYFTEGLVYAADNSLVRIGRYSYGSSTQYYLNASSGGVYFLGKASVGWHNAKIVINGNSSQLWLDGILCYQGAFHATGIGAVGASYIRFRTLLSGTSQAASAKTGYFANIKWGTVDVSVASATDPISGSTNDWTSITALGTTTWGV